MAIGDMAVVAAVPFPFPFPLTPLQKRTYQRVSDPGFRGRSPSIFPAGSPDRPKSTAPVRFDAMAPVPTIRWPQFSIQGGEAP